MNGVDVGSLVLRVCVGFVMFAHGWNHAFRGGKLEGTGRWFESIGIKPGWLNARLATYTELLVGPMLMLGLLTPLAAAGVVGTMSVALIANHLKNGFFIFRPGEGYEYVVTLIAAAVCIGAIGGGRISIDNALGIADDFEGAGAAALTFFGGAAGSALTLLLFWRPSRRAS